MTHPKSALNAYCQKVGLGKPEFDTKNAGDSGEPLYISDVIVGGQVVATGQGQSRREAERVAAELALEALKARYGEPRGKRGKRSKEPPAGNTPPLLPELLVESLRVAHQRVPQNLKGAEAAEQVARLAGEIYKGLIEEIGIPVE